MACLSRRFISGFCCISQLSLLSFATLTPSLLTLCNRGPFVLTCHKYKQNRPFACCSSNLRAVETLIKPVDAFLSCFLQDVDSTAKNNLAPRYFQGSRLWSGDCLYERRRAARKQRAASNDGPSGEVIYDSPSGSADLRNVLADRPLS